jgi:hypothetical protein
MGFKTTAIKPSQLMLVIAVMTKRNASVVAQLTEAEVDAVLIHSKDLGRELPTIQKIAGPVNDIPWGVWPETVNEDSIEELKGMGGDFIIFVASEAPASLLQDDIGKVIKITTPFEDGFIVTIDQLPIDAVLLDFREEGENLTVSQLMNCQWIADSINKPLLLAVQQRLGDKEMQALWEVGVKGVVVEIEEEPLAELVRLRQAIAALSPVSRKPGEKRAVLPRLELEEDSVSPDEI